MFVQIDNEELKQLVDNNKMLSDKVIWYERELSKANALIDESKVKDRIKREAYWLADDIISVVFKKAGITSSPDHTTNARVFRTNRLDDYLNIVNDDMTLNEDALDVELVGRFSKRIKWAFINLIKK